MRKTNKPLRRLTAGLVCLCLLLGILVPAALALDGDIHISSAADWRRLAQNCRLDTWSQGKTVVLDCDLDLTGEASIPTFGGTFDGQGHTIRGWKLEGEGSHRGLFRYVQEGAVVKNLNVSGTVSVSGEWSGFGGIAGVNRGTIAQCAYTGVMDAPDRVGGIAGINEAAGALINCTSSGVISGEHFTGGIAGENYGSIIQCTNKARINTRGEEVSPDLDGIDWGNLNSTENIPACTDTGGIVGYSKGVLQGCVNFGDVGYPHTGYNVGGIAGRQAGYVNNCVNHGNIRGRKEVGGIIGQMEPYTQLRFQEDTLQRMAEELSTLQSLMGTALDNTDRSRQQLSAHLTAVGDLTDSARGDVGGLLEDLEMWGDGTVDTVNDLSARISRVLDRAVPVMEDLEEGTGQIGGAVGQLEEALRTLENAGDSASQGAKVLREALKELRGAFDRVEQAMAAVGEALEHLKEAVGLDKETGEAEKELDQALGELSDALKETADTVGNVTDAAEDLEDQPGWQETADAATSLETVGKALRESASAVDTARGAGESLLPGATGDPEALQTLMEHLEEALEHMTAASGKIREALDRLQDAAPHWEDMGDKAQEASQRFRKALRTMKDAGDAMDSALSGLKELLKEQTEQPALEFPKLDSAFHEKEDSLSTTLDRLSQELRSMQSTADGVGDTLGGDLRRINDQFGVITNLLRDSGEEEEDRVVDTSEEDHSITMGTAADCVNRGGVEGDVNTGGVAGSMAVELDFDPEDDIVRQGDASVNFQYLTHAVLRACVNHAAVTGRKDCVGSVVGRAEVGVITGCQGYGSVESSSGAYVGGIAGRSAVPIRDCWAKCDLSGGSHVGGIAGLAEDQLSGCRTLVRMEETAYSGAIAGETQGTLADNYFVSDDLGGVDGISYAGQAEPVAYGDLLDLGAPEEFSTFALTFTADDVAVKQVSFSYGKGIREDDIPVVPEKEGFYGAWEEFDRTALTFDDTIKAVYTPWVTTLSDEDGSILAEGTFAPGTELRTSEEQGETPATKGEVLLHQSVSVDGGAPFTALRVLKPENVRKAELWCRTEQGPWRQLACTKEGSYLRAELETNAAELCLVKTESGTTIWIGGAVALAAVGILLLAVGHKPQKPKGSCEKKARIPEKV